ncbi:MAG: heavy-metal-associated domain-containing protein, partial [Muribaculaceae bacterium]
MKQILTTLLLVIAFAITANAKTEPVKAYFTLEPQITNQNLENKVKTGMRYQTGVQAVEVNRQQQVVTITYDPAKTTVEALIEAFKEIGFTAKTTDAPKPTTCPEGHQSSGC